MAAAFDEGLSRSLYFNAHALPVLAHYRLVEASLAVQGQDSDAEKAAALAPLHRRYAPLVLDVIRALRGFYIKIGQLGATRSDFVAQEYIERCETLQDACPHETLEYVQALLERSLGRPWRDVFASIDPRPLGAASIGQVHRATLRDGREVAVKVQYPGVEQLFRGDLRTIRAFCELAQPEQLPALDEVERAFMTEFDYTREADALTAAADNAARAPFASRVAVPRPLRELCTRDVLLMEFLDGEKLVDALRRQYSALAAARGLTLAELQAAYVKAGSGDGRPTAPVAPPAWRAPALRAALRAADALHNAPLRLRNAAARLRGAPTQPLRSTPTPLDVEGILALLAEVHAHAIFQDGLFNGDCHPGNVLLLRDGRLGLIDWGQVSSLTLQQRAQIARVVVALADGDKPAAVAAMRATGYATQHSNDDLCWRIASISWDRDDREITRGLNLQAFMEQQALEDPVMHVPDALVMASRNSLLLRGMGLALGRPISVAQAWRPAAARFLREHPEL